MSESTKSMNVREGGYVEFGDGSRIEVPAHSQRVHGDIWHNGCFIEVLFYEEEQPGEHPSDRIQLLVTDSEGIRDGWLMNVDDALSIVRGLVTAIQIAIESDTPVR